MSESIPSAIEQRRPSTYKSLCRGRLIGGRILDALDGGGGGEGRLADGLLGGDAKGISSGKACNNGKGGEAHGGNTTWTGADWWNALPVGSLQAATAARADIIERINSIEKRK